MSLSISKLVDLVGADTRKSDGKLKGSEDIPRMRQGSDLTKSQYYNSVKGRKMPMNVGNVLQRGTPSGAQATPYSETIEIPNFSRPDGAIDPNRNISITDPNRALPYRFAGYGLEGGVSFDLPASTKTSFNNLGLLRKAQASYQNRQQIMAPRSADLPDTGARFAASSSAPPSYEQATGSLDTYKDGSELDSSYV
jgi:hypothetical protein